MKLSFIFELLLIFILIAFAASAAVLDSGRIKKTRNAVGKKQGKVAHKKRQNDNSNRYCSCSTKLCNCCREFNIPVVSLQGPGCASLQYLKGDRLAISMSFGERVLTNTTISSKKPQPVCMPLPGGVSKFCGRVYNIERKGEEFNACLGLELRAVNEVEAALRVSCFRFGPNGLKVEPPKPLPIVDDEKDEDEDDDDEDDDDDDDDDFDFDDDEDDDDDEEDDTENDVDTVDYGTFSVFDDDFIGEYFQEDSSGTKKKPVKVTSPPVRKITKKPIVSNTLQRKPPKRKVVAKPKPKPTTMKITTAVPKVTTTTTTTESPVMIPVEIEEVKMPEVLEFSTSQPHETIATVSAILQEPSKEVLPEAAMVPAPVQITSSLSQQSSSQIITNEVLSMTDLPKLPDTTITEQYVQKETATLTEKTVAETTQTSFIEKEDDSDESEEDEDDDPIVDAVEDALSDEDESDEETTASEVVTNPTASLNKTGEKQKSKDVVDDIVDGVIDTFAGEDDSNDGSNKTETKNDDKDEDDDDDDDILDDGDDDEDDDESEEDEESRKLKKKTIKGKHGRRQRQSRDMWLDRLHW